MGEENEDKKPTLLETWPNLAPEERLHLFNHLPRIDAEEIFYDLGSAFQAELITALPTSERRSWIRLLAPDDAADLIQHCEKEHQDELLELLDRVARREVLALLAYNEDEAGGLMNPRFARVRPEMHVDEAISYLRRQARRSVETISYAYVLDEAQKLLGVVSLRSLFVAEPSSVIRELMETEISSAKETDKQEDVAKLLAANDLVALPVLDDEGRMKGIVTFDDVVDVLQEETTEDIQKIGGMEALHEPYITASFGRMIRSRAGWLSALFIGELLTASAMAVYETEISQAVVLALFIPLIISSGGNAGSQASTLIIRSLALGEIRTRHWYRVLARELAAGVALGAILGLLGFLRIYLWPNSEGVYGVHYAKLSVAVSLSVVFVVLWGTVVGSMLPLALSRLRFDPASASAPFVATLVDVTGLVIYFTIAHAILAGSML